MVISLGHDWRSLRRQGTENGLEVTCGWVKAVGGCIPPAVVVVAWDGLLWGRLGM